MGQFDRKFGSGPLFGLNPDHPVMLIDDFLGDHQPDAGALRSFGRKKAFKNILLSGSVHTAAIIQHLLFNPPAAGFFYADGHHFI